jgi:hypothetical protein
MAWLADHRLAAPIPNGLCRAKVASDMTRDRH